ncbi:MAG: hypothetical protein ACFFBD_14170 [Candidatus Hodarchaeota archaeon]
MKVLYYKIYGERNSGTNYLNELIKMNFQIKEISSVFFNIFWLFIGRSEGWIDLFHTLSYRYAFGWKHSMAPTPDDLSYKRANKVLFLSITKNPYAWLVSLHRRPHHYKGVVPPFELFLTTPWETLKRDRYTKAFKNPIVLWNEKNRSYLNLKRFKYCHNIIYEKLLEDPETILNEIAKIFSIPKKPTYFTNVFQPTKNEDLGKKNLDFYRRYYLEEKWKEELNENSLKIINKYLDKEILDEFGYSLII